MLLRIAISFKPWPEPKRVQDESDPLKKFGFQRTKFPGSCDRWNGGPDAPALTSIQPRNEPVIHNTAPTTPQSSGSSRGENGATHAPLLARSLLVQEAMAAGHPVWLRNLVL
jgi:hypothetical protein